MTWSGPTWSQWHGVAGEADAAMDASEQNYAAAQKWKAYAARLEAELDEVWALYRDAKGNGAGQRRLKELALEEVGKLDPANKLLDQKYRQGIMDKEYDEAAKKVIRQ